MKNMKKRLRNLCLEIVVLTLVVLVVLPSIATALPTQNATTLSPTETGAVVLSFDDGLERYFLLWLSFDASAWIEGLLQHCH